MLSRVLHSFATPWKELRHLPRSLFVVAFATMVNRMGTMAFPFLLLYLTRARHYSPGEAGTVIAMFGLSGLVTAPIAGRLCDRFHPVRIMQASLLGTAVALSIYPHVSGRGAILVASICWAVVAEAFRPASLMLRAELVGPSHRKQAQSLIRLSNNLGMSLGPAMGGILAQYSFQYLFWIDGVTSFLAAAILLWAFRKGMPRGYSGVSPSTSSVPSVGPLRDKRFLGLMVPLIAVLMVFFQSQSTMSLFVVRDLKLSEAFFGLSISVNTLMIVFLEIPVSHASAQWRHRVSLVIGTCFFALGFGALALVTGPWGLAVTVVIWSIGEMILFPSLVTYVMDIAPQSRRGEYMGMYVMALSVATVVGPWVGIQIYEHYGPTVLWISTFLLATFSALMFSRTTHGTVRYET